MEVKSLRYKITLPHADIYLEDVVTVAEMMAENNRSIRFSFECDDKSYKIDSVDEIANLSSLGLSNINDLQISCYDKASNQFASLSTNSIVVTEKTPESIYLIDRIEGVFKKRGRLRNILSHTWIPYSLIAGYITISLIRQIIDNFLLAREVIVSALIPVVVWNAIGYLFAALFLASMIADITNKETNVYAKYRSEAPNFFKKNRDHFLVGLILVIISFFLGRIT